MPDPNIEQLLAVARKLRPLLDDLVFVGGCATGLLITDTSAPSVRATFDVDAIAKVSTYSEYVALSERLRELGFSEDSSEGAPVCRWISGSLVLDVMPLDARVLGFSNRWYGEAVRTSTSISLERSLSIRVVTAPVFLATKLEAFKSRGKGDYFGSHDLEDALSVYRRASRTSRRDSGGSASAAGISSRRMECAFARSKIRRCPTRTFAARSVQQRAGRSPSSTDRGDR